MEAESHTESENIFNVTEETFVAASLSLFRLQAKQNPVYRAYIEQLRVNADQVEVLEQIPPLPIDFFKTGQVTCFSSPPEMVFTSSGTTGSIPSRHPVRRLSWYEACFTRSFFRCFGSPSDYAWLCLLPSYLERSGSSLVYMADHFIRGSSYSQSGFYLRADRELAAQLQECRNQKVPVILLGVTYALLDFASAYNGLDLSGCLIMETGGMKGRREEMTRAEVHERLKSAFGVHTIYSEYGMTELMSQAYSMGGGLFTSPPWMKVLVRSEDDPFQLSATGSGLLTVFDLGNQDSCAFIETADLATIHPDGSFEVLGRQDHSDLRGCSLLTM